MHSKPGWLAAATGLFVAIEMALYSLWPHLDDNDRVPGLSNSWK